MKRLFYLHVHPGSPLIDEVRAVVEPSAIFTKDWVAPVRTVPTIQFFPEVNELIEGEDAIRQYIETLRPRPMARARLAPIKTKPVEHKPIEHKPAEQKPIEQKEDTTPAPEAAAPPKPQTNDEVLRDVRSELTKELKKASAKKPRKTGVRVQKPLT